MFLFLPFLFDIRAKRKVIDPTARVCPKCNNVSVMCASSRLWFSFFLVRVIPLRQKFIWVCSVCNWYVPLQHGWEPALPAVAAVPSGNARGRRLSHQGYQQPYQTSSPRPRSHSTGYQQSHQVISPRSTGYQQSNQALSPRSGYQPSYDIPPQGY